VNGHLADRVALVTGSSRGVGAGIAELFAREGAHVVVHGRDTAALEAVRDRLAAHGGSVLTVVGDTTSLDDLTATREAIERERGPVDVLVANAGGSPVRPGAIEDITEADWRASIDANLTATFLTLKTFLPSMKQRGSGAVVTMSSAAARRPSAMSPVAYAAAKAGIELLTRDAAAQAGPFGVRVNCIAPETILTERTSLQIPADVQAALRDAHPIRRLGTPTDVAEAALYLASDAASWVSGIVLDVAGGAVFA